MILSSRWKHDNAHTIVTIQTRKSQRIEGVDLFGDSTDTDGFSLLLIMEEG